MRPSRQLSGLLFLALAAVLAWGGTVDPARSTIRWIVVAAAAGWGIWTLGQERTRIEQVYTQILALGLAISAVGWLIPTTESRGLMVVGGILVLAAGGLLLWAWMQRHAPPSDDDANRTG
jgi:hypothetical protein